MHCFPLNVPTYAYFYLNLSSYLYICLYSYLCFFFFTFVFLFLYTFKFVCVTSISYPSSLQARLLVSIFVYLFVFIFVFLFVFIFLFFLLHICMRDEHLLPRFPLTPPPRLLWPYNCLLPNILTYPHVMCFNLYPYLHFFCVHICVFSSSCMMQHAAMGGCLPHFPRLRRCTELESPPPGSHLAPTLIAPKAALEER